MTKRVITVESRRTDYRTSSVPAFPQQFEGVSKPSYTGQFGMWQYTSGGSVNGIGTRVDRNIAYQDYPGIIKGAGLNGWKAEEEPPLQTPDEKEKYEMLCQQYEALEKRHKGLTEGMDELLGKYR